MTDDLQKQAMAGAFLKNLVRNGVWKTVGNLAARGAASKGLGGAAARGLGSTAKFMGGGGGTALGAYGLAGFMEPLTGINLPGSSLAFNLATPGWGAAFTAAPAISSMRLNSEEQKKKIEADARQGAQNAAADFISTAAYDPRAAADASYYRKLLEQNGIDFKAADQYRNRTRVKDMSSWQRLGSVFENPDNLVLDKVRRNVQGYLDKEASVLKSVGKAVNKALPWLMGTAAAGSIGNALLSDKPYDSDAVKQEGYAGAQEAIQKKLQGMNAIERLAVKFDPTLAVRGLEQKLPGTIKAWENRSGMQYRPGILSSIADYWESGGGEPSYYQVDASGNRHYLK